MKITVRGMDEIRAIFRQLDDLTVLEQPMQRSAQRLRDHIGDYSRVAGARRPSYRRTGRLGRGWAAAVNRLSGNLAITVSNRVPYGPFVQGQRTQTSAHRRNGWKTDKQVLDQEQGNILREMETAVQSVVNK